MTLEDRLPIYLAFRERLRPIFTKPIPSDPVAVFDQRSLLEQYYLEAMDYAAEMESIYLSKAAMSYETAECSWEYAKAQAHTERMWAKKAEAAVKAIESRSIKLSQQMKITEHR